MSRISKDEYVMRLAMTAAKRGTCSRRQVGCVIVDLSGRVLATGYNGSLPSTPHCSDTGHLMVDGHCARTVHAEVNAVADAARRGTSIAGAVAYCTTHPCINCFKLLAAAGVTEVVYCDPYSDETHREDQHALVNELNTFDNAKMARDIGAPIHFRQIDTPE